MFAKKHANPGQRRTLFQRIIIGMLWAVSLPLVLWMIGTLIVRIAPPVYRSEAVVKWPTESVETARDLASSPKVIEVASAALANDGTPKLMAGQSLRTNLQLKAAPHAGLVRIETTGRDPAEAQRVLAAVLDAYQHSAAGAPVVIYTPPTDTTPVEVSHGMRLVLGAAGLSMLGLLLSIPLLQRLEQKHPVPATAMPRRPVVVSATVPASAEAVFPHDSGCLPAVRPAG